MACATWLQDDPTKVAGMQAFTVRVNDASGIDANHGMGDVRSNSPSDYPAHRLRRGRQHDVARLDELIVEPPVI